MLLSMTGFGEAHRQHDTLTVAVELRTINSKYLKLNVRSPERYGAIEPKIEAVVRKQIRRGTVMINLRIDRARTPDEYRIDTDVLVGYRRQLDALHEQLHIAESVSLEALLALPGVVDEAAAVPVEAEEDWPLIAEALKAALAQLETMRTEEGRAMAEDLATNRRIVAEQLDKIELRAPLVAEHYRKRLNDRLAKVMAEHELTLEPADLIREVGIYAERSDISEEIVRLRSHLEQFAATMQLPESSGRKLEFVTQEMFRETNTIGSKANDPEISQHVVEIKSAIERIREMIQNVE
jgi:uncharacterized protein (TIGR00255 family)